MTVEPAAADPPPSGAFVALTIRGRGRWAPELTWSPHAVAPAVREGVARAASTAGAAYMYSRVLGDDEGSVTVLPRHEQGSTP